MDYNNDNNRYFYETKDNSGRKMIIVALVGGLIGALVMAVIAPYLLYGNIIPWPEHLSRLEGEYILPDPAENISQGDYDLKDLGNQISAVAEAVGPAVVGVTNKGLVKDLFGRTSLVEKSSGSGFIIDPQGYVVTNQHVIAGAREVIVTLSNGAKVEATVVGEDEWSDLAVLKVDVSGLPEDERSLPYASFGDSSRLKVGYFVVAIGNPLGLEFARTTTHGIVSAVDRILSFEGRQYSLIQIDAAINNGNSGGPLLDLDGNVVGINQIKIASSGIEGLGFAIPANQAKPIVEQLITYGRVIRPYLGIRGYPMNPDYADYINSDIDYGVYIEEVVPNSPVGRAGILAGDIITAINGEQVTGFTELQRILYSYKIGDTIKVEIYRVSEKKKYDFEVTLESIPQ